MKKQCMKPYLFFGALNNTKNFKTLHWLRCFQIPTSNLLKLLIRWGYNKITQFTLLNNYQINVKWILKSFPNHSTSYTHVQKYVHHNVWQYITQSDANLTSICRTNIQETSWTYSSNTKAFHNSILFNILHMTYFQVPF